MAPISTAILALLAHYRETGALSADYITKELHFHPMAEAKYLSAIAQLHKDGVLSREEFAQASSASLSRLKSAALSRYDDGYVWGLGFVWLDRPADEPYLITSSICTQALLDATSLLENIELRQAAEKAVKGLSMWVVSDRISSGHGETIPAYSPTVRAPIYNPGAHAAGTLAYARNRGFLLPSKASGFPEEMLSELERVRVPNVGWPYSTSRSVSDLIHINYILHAYLALLPTEEVEEMFLPIAGQYMSGGGLSDRVRILGTDDNFVWDGKIPRNAVVRRSGHTWYSVDEDRALLWGIGELLVSAGTLARRGVCSAYWRNVIGQIVNSFNGDTTSMNEFARFHRHTLHLAHGLAVALPFISPLANSQGLTDFLDRCVSR